MERIKGNGAFIFTSLGAAMGLGNALRFPGLCARYGGAFIAAYAAVLILIGYPLLKRELALGKRLRSPFPYAMRTFGRAACAVGWAACVNSALIAVYYSAITARLASGSLTFAVSVFSGCPVAVPGSAQILTAAAWALLFFMLTRGASARAKAAKFAVTAQIAMLSSLAFRGLLFKNSLSALAALFVPRAEAFADPFMWLNATGQGLLSLSVAAGVMPAFAEGMPDKLSPDRCALIVIAANFLGCLLSSIALLTNAYGGNLVADISENGIDNAFRLYPAVLKAAFKNTVVCGVYGGLFYLSLTFTAVISSLSLIFAAFSPLCAKLPRRTAAAALCAACAVCSVPLAIWFDGVYTADFITCSLAAPAIAVAEACVFVLRRKFFTPVLTKRRRGVKIGLWKALKS